MMLSAAAGSQPPLDTEQLARIEATHRGFLFQHLVGVTCLLQVAAGTHEALVVERDEDLELVRPDGRWYLQVKHLGSPLTPSGVEDVLTRFRELRSAHESGNRSGEARFFLVSSSEPGPKLAKMLKRRDWPNDVEVVTPRRESADLGVVVDSNVTVQPTPPP